MFQQIKEFLFAFELFYNFCTLLKYYYISFFTQGPHALTIKVVSQEGACHSLKECAQN